MTEPGLILAPSGEGAIAVEERTPAEACIAYVAGHPRGTGYHLPAWLSVIRAAFGHKTTYLAARRDEAVVGVLPLVFFSSRVFGRAAVSMPFLNYGGVLADDSRVERALLTRAIEITTAAGAAHLELRHTRQLFPDLPAKRHKVAMLLPLAPSPEAQWERLDRKVRNQVRKAEKSGLSVEIGGIELLARFYTVFARNMRDLGTPVYGVEFFEQVLRTFPHSARVCVVATKGQPVAASIVYWHGRTIEVPWASALREFNPLCPNILLYWQMLRFAVEQGFATYDFGRSTPGEGTFQFKRQWGAEPHELVWEYWMAGGRTLPDLSPKNPKFSVAIRAWRQLPVSVATSVGPLIVRNIP